MDKHYQPIHVGQGIYISHRDACGKFLVDRILHIWRDDMPDNSCEDVAVGRATGMILNYRDGESLVKSNINLDHVASFFEKPGIVLVHCTVGQTRSPTIALVGKVVRGVSVYDAIADITRANWVARQVVCNWCITPLKEILGWAEGRIERRSDDDT